MRPDQFFLKYNSDDASNPAKYISRGRRWGFAGCGIRSFLSAEYGIGSKIVAGFGIQISAGFGIDQKIIAGYWIQISRGNGIRSEIFSVYPKWPFYILLHEKIEIAELTPQNIKI